jgi:hypothetical protein
MVLAGCSEGEELEAPARTTVAPPTEDAPATTEPSTEAAVTSSSAPTLSAREQDEADVEETLLRYTRALNDSFNGDASVEDIYPCSRDTAREQCVTEVMAAEAQGITFSGLTKLEDLEVSVDGDTAEAVACADVSAVEAVDQNGTPSLPRTGVVRLSRTTSSNATTRRNSAATSLRTRTGTSRATASTWDGGEDELDAVAHEPGGVGVAGELADLVLRLWGQDDLPDQARGLDPGGVVDVAVPRSPLPWSPSVTSEAITR